MATAKQIAARKEFARIMKSGGFGPKKKGASAKRKRNPVAAPAPGVRPTNLMNRSRSGYEQATRVNAIPVDKMRTLKGGGRNSGSRSSNSWDGDDGRAANPIKRRRNPSSRSIVPGAYKVFLMKADGTRLRQLAAFPAKADAVEYGKAYAKAHNKPVGITGSK